MEISITVETAAKVGWIWRNMSFHSRHAIVGVHRAVDRAVVRDGAIVIRTIANLTVTFDHRVIDGAEAGEFAIALARRIERGAEMLDA